MKIEKMLFIIAAMSLGTSPLLFAADAGRQQEIAERGAQVMPFDLEQTMHLFQPQKDGGLQRVTAKDANNKAQIDLIRAHLKEEAQRFARGDFSDPARIHGADMPGLSELSRGIAHVTVRYAELPAGGEIHYTSAEPAMIEAIHRWFAAQVHDHGRHATTHQHQHH